MDYVDLTVPLNENTPVFPGDPKVKVAQAGSLEKNGYQDHNISISTHVGTHIDAPAHMVAGGKNIDEFPIEKFFGNGVYIKVDGSFDLESIKSVGIEEDDIVLFHTGMGSKYFEAEYFEKYPAMTEDVANYLVSKGVKIVGFDSCSPDHDPFSIHKILLGNDILIIENLTNLDQLAGQQFKIYALPIKLEVDGAPVRVVAEIL